MFSNSFRVFDVGWENLVQILIQKILLGPGASRINIIFDIIFLKEKDCYYFQFSLLVF